MSVINLSKLAENKALFEDEIRTPARAEMVDKICSKCKVGRMNQTGRAAQPDPQQPPIFEHICSKCRHKEAYGKQYPRVEFIKVEAEEGNES